MLVLIDESGCAGFKETSSPFFVVAMVIFTSFESAEAASCAIKILQKERNIFPEFQFAKCSSTVRDVFFETIKKQDFMVYSAYFEKKRIRSDFLRQHPRKFYNFCIRLPQKLDYVQGFL